MGQRKHPWIQFPVLKRKRKQGYLLSKSILLDKAHRHKGTWKIGSAEVKITGTSSWGGGPRTLCTLSLFPCLSSLLALPGCSPAVGRAPQPWVGLHSTWQPGQQSSSGSLGMSSRVTSHSGSASQRPWVDPIPGGHGVTSEAAHPSLTSTTRQ